MVTEKGSQEQLLSISTTGRQTKEQPVGALNLRTKGKERQTGVTSEDRPPVRNTEEAWEKICTGTYAEVKQRPD